VRVGAGRKCARIISDKTFWYLLSDIYDKKFVVMLYEVIFSFIIMNKDIKKLNKLLSGFYSVAYSFVSLHVPCIPIAKQRLGKHIPATNVHATIEGYLSLRNGAVNTVFSITSDPRLYNESL
jgi:hypothetical protein